MDNTIQPQDGTNLETEVEVTESTEETTESSPEETVSKEELEKALARAKASEIRAKKAEEEIKKIKSSKPSNTADINNTNSLSEELIEVKILKSQGLTDEMIQELKAVAKARGKGLLESKSDPIFVAIQTEKENEIKAQKAKLGASKGYSTAKKEKSLNSAGLSDEEHKRLWKEQNEK